LALFAFTSEAIISRDSKLHDRLVRRTPTHRTLLIDLVPDFLAVVDASDPVAAYDAYFRANERLLRAYWQNYVFEPEGADFRDVVRATVAADRTDLRTMLARTDVIAIARSAEARCREALAIDVDVDVVLMVGVGAANAGELVLDGRGVAFVCLEHFTGVANPRTHGLGLDPELLSLWLAHEITHTVRYTAPSSRSEMRSLIEDAGGNYSYWNTARQATLRELLVNEGLAVQASRLVSPGHAVWEYFGYTRREFARVRELERVIARAASSDLDRSGLGFRLRYLSGGMSDRARTVERTVLPERSGYFLGARMVEPAIEQHGLAWAVRAPAAELTSSVLGAAQSA
jgi:hypothetical protein